MQLLIKMNKRYFNWLTIFPKLFSGNQSQKMLKNQAPECCSATW